MQKLRFLFLSVLIFSLLSACSPTTAEPVNPINSGGAEIAGVITNAEESPLKDRSYEDYFSTERYLSKPDLEEIGISYADEETGFLYIGNSWDELTLVLEKPIRLFQDVINIPGNKLIVIAEGRQIIEIDKGTFEQKLIWEDEDTICRPTGDAELIYFLKGDNTVCRLHVQSGIMDEILVSDADKKIDLIIPLSNYALLWYTDSPEWKQYLAEGGSPDDWETVGRRIPMSEQYFYNAKTGENQLMEPREGNREYRISETGSYFEYFPIDTSYEEYLSEERAFIWPQAEDVIGDFYVDDTTGFLCMRSPSGQYPVIVLERQVRKDFQYVCGRKLIVIADNQYIIEIDQESLNWELLWDSGDLSISCPYADNEVVFYLSEDNAIWRFHRSGVGDLILDNTGKEIASYIPLSNYYLLLTAYSPQWNEYIAEGGSPIVENAPDGMQVYETYLYNANTRENRLVDEQSKNEILSSYGYTIKINGAPHNIFSYKKGK